MTSTHRISSNLRWPGFRAIAWAGATVIVMAGLTSSAFAQESEKPLQKELKQQTVEKVTIKKLPPPDARRVYVTDSRAFEVFTQNFAIDGNTGTYAGTIDTGLLPVPVPSPDGSKLYIADTYYEGRGDTTTYTHETRRDVVRIVDPRTLTQTGKIDIPKGNTRFLGMSQESYTQISPDGRYLFVYQFVPNNAIGIVDLKAKKYLNAIKTPQCFYAFPTTDRRVVMHCRDGSLLQVSFDENGKAINKTTTEPFHKPVEEPVYNDPAFSVSAGKIFFISHGGKVFPVDISGDQPKPGESWKLATEEERKANWKPGGWQLAAYQPENSRLYVLMDQRVKWSQNTESNYVWVYDTTTGEKVDEIHLAHPARGLYVDRGSPSYLYAISSHHANLTIYNAETGAVQALIDELGHEPILAVGPS